MQVKQILKEKGPKVWSIKTTQTIRDALHLLVNQKIGTLLVFDDEDKTVGIISERDIMRLCYHRPKDFEAQHVAQVMTKKVIIGSPEDEIDYIMGIMTQNRVRHIPIITDGKLHGMISIGDVVKARVKESAYENRYLKEYMFGGDNPQ